MNSHRFSGMISLRTTAVVIAVAAVAAIAFAQMSTSGMDKPVHRASAKTDNGAEIAVLDAEYPSKSYYYLPDQHTLHADAKEGNTKTYERD